MSLNSAKRESDFAEHGIELRRSVFGGETV